MIWNLDNDDPVIHSPVRTIECHKDVILSMSFNTNGGLMATSCKDRKIRIIDPHNGRVLQVCIFTVMCFRFNGDSNCLVHCTCYLFLL